MQARLLGEPFCQPGVDISPDVSAVEQEILVAARLIRCVQQGNIGIKLPPKWEPPRGNSHIYPTQVAPIICRTAELNSGDEAVPEFEIVDAHFGLLPGFAKEIKYGLQTYNTHSETVMLSFYQKYTLDNKEFTDLERISFCCKRVFHLSRTLLFKFVNKKLTQRSIISPNNLFGN